MALPAIIGLSALGSLFTKVIEKLVDFAFSRTAKKILVMTGIFSALFLAVQLLFTILVSSISPLLSSLPVAVTSLMGAALPSNTLTCLSAVVAVEIACITYSLTLKSLDYQSKVV